MSEWCNEHHALEIKKKFCNECALSDEISKLKKIIEKYKECVEFYADEGTWCPIPICDGIHYVRTDVGDWSPLVIGIEFKKQPRRHGGEIARQCLKEVEELNGAMF